MTEHEVKLAPIGLRVMVRGTQSRQHDSTWTLISWGCASWQCFTKPKEAFLVGWVTASDGKHVEGYTHGFYNADLYYTLARVRFSARGREYYARPEDVEPVENERDTIPASYWAGYYKRMADCYDAKLKAHDRNVHALKLQVDRCKYVDKRGHPLDNKMAYLVLVTPPGVEIPSPKAVK